MIPYFKRQQYADGLIAGTMAVAEIVAKESGISLKQIEGGANVVPRSRQRRPMSPMAKIFRVIFIIIMIPVVIRNPWLLLLFMGGGRGGGWSGGGFGGGFGGFGGGMSGGGGGGGGW